MSKIAGNIAIEVGHWDFEDASRALIEKDVSTDSPGDELTRSQILSQANKFVYWAVQQNQVIVQSHEGRTLFTVNDSEHKNSKIVEIEFVPHVTGGISRWTGKTKFWMNASSLSDLSAKLRSHPENRAFFHEIYQGKKYTKILE